jgi:predicted Zn-dependent protease
VTYRLDARLRLNAGAEVGFRSRRILVGPSLVLLAESEDALAFVLGHELAHVVHHHTKFKAAQDLLVHALTFGYGGGAPGEAIAGVLSQGSMPAFNRDKECEADYYALQYMRAAGYRPEAVAEFWKVLLALRPQTSRQRIPFVSGRPPEAERVLRLARWADVDLLSPAPSFDGGAPAAMRDLSPKDAIESFGLVLE